MRLSVDLEGRYTGYKTTSLKCKLEFSFIGEDQQARNLMIWVVDTIGQVFRVYPDKARSEIEQVFNPIATLISSENIDAELEESCLHALIWTGHHLQLQVCKFLADWKPRFVTLLS